MRMDELTDPVVYLDRHFQVCAENLIPEVGGKPIYFHTPNSILLDGIE